MNLISEQIRPQCQIYISLVKTLLFLLTLHIFKVFIPLFSSSTILLRVVIVINRNFHFLSNFRKVKFVKILEIFSLSMNSFFFLCGFFAFCFKIVIFYILESLFEKHFLKFFLSFFTASFFLLLFFLSLLLNEFVRIYLQIFHLVIKLYLFRRL